MIFLLITFHFFLQEDQTDSSSCDSDRSENCYSRTKPELSERYQVTDLHQILGSDDQHRQHLGQPGHQGGQHAVPVYWSASQLLSKLDQKQGRSSDYEDQNKYGFSNSR